jgi:hypothetical protein
VADYLYETCYGNIGSVARVNRAMKKKIFSDFYLVVTELDKAESNRVRDYISECSPDFQGMLPKLTSDALFRVELWRTK